MSTIQHPPSLTISSVPSINCNNSGGLSSTTIPTGVVGSTMPNSGTSVIGPTPNLPAGTTLSAISVKQERHDEAEIQEMAALMRHQQKLAMAKQAAQQQQQISNRLPPNQIIPPGTGGQANILNYLTRKPGNQQNDIAGTVNTHGNNQISSSSNGNGKSSSHGNSSADENKKPCDEESQKGRFGWATFGKIHIPYISRQSEKYCAVRMVELKLLNKYLGHLHPDIYSSCTCVRSYYITEAESKLLNEINTKHCDAQFGRENFTQKDLVVRLSDANKFYQFLDICYRKLLTGSKTVSDKCGFIRINQESVVPYTVRNGEQVVPLFYFEGETENLRQKADYLSGWDLAYLKFCCKVQGIRNELFSSESVAVISLTDIKSYFPTGTEFEDYWPNKFVEANLFASKNPNNSAINWTRQPTAPPPKINNVPTSVPKSTQNHIRKVNPYNPIVQTSNITPRMNSTNIVPSQSGITAAVQAALTNGWHNLSQASMLSHSQTEQLFRAAAVQAQQQNARVYSQNRNQMQNMMTNPARSYSTYTGNMPLSSINCSQGQQPPPLVRSQTQNQCQMSTATAPNAAALLQHHQQQQQQQQQQRMAQGLMQNGRPQGNNVQSAAVTAAMLQQRHSAAAAATQAMDHHSNEKVLRVIPEIPTGSIHLPPYKVQKVFVFENAMVPCINMKAYNDADQLMTLTDFKEYFFPNVPLEHCKRLIDALNIDMYKANRRQTQTLIESGKPHTENIPLIQVRDVMKYMPQLKYMMRSQEHPPNKRARIS